MPLLQEVQRRWQLMIYDAVVTVVVAVIASRCVTVCDCL